MRRLLGGVLAIAAGCAAPRWDVAPELRARDAEVAAALGDSASESDEGISPDDVPEIAYPRKLRPCCAFGADLQVALGRVPVPGVEIGNLVAPDDVGHHRYDNGFLSLQRGDPRGAVDVEQNGLVYTCRGGFIDLAHVRDNADNTLSIAASVARSLETGTVIELPPQGAVLRLRVRAIPEEAVARYGRMPLAVALAQWLAYQVSIWHEIATFYGYTAIPSWPEKLSAFSPEDLYSNELGVRIAGGVILARSARSNVEYGLAMDSWLERALARLEAVPLDDARAALQAVDGAWWDSSTRIPEWTLVRRRALDLGPKLRPWLAPLAACADAAPPLALRVHDGFRGARFRDHASAEFEVDEALVAAGFPLPRADSTLVTQEDFPAIVARIRAEVLEQLGPGADAP